MSNKPTSIRRNPTPSRTSKRRSASGALVRNLILSDIPDREYNLIRPHLEAITTNEYQSIHEPGDKLEYAYFPNRGMVCVVAETSDGKTLEVGLATHAGFAGESLAV